MLCSVRAFAGRPKPTAERLIFLAAAAVGLYLLFFHRLAARDLWSSHEARAGMNAQSILDTGNWVVPTLFDGTPELQKPPLYYWLVALAATMRGSRVDALDVRIPAAVAALLCVGLLLLLGWARGRPRLGICSACVLATALSFPTLARTGRIDMPLTLAVSGVIIPFHLAVTNCTGNTWARTGLLVCGYAGLAAGVLLKGPIAVVLPAAVVLVQALVERRSSTLGLWWGIPLVTLLTAPWFVEAHMRTGGEFTRVFFWYHNWARGWGGSTLRGHPWWFYGPHLAWGFLPWSLLVPLGCWCCWKRNLLCEDAEMRLGATWLIAMFVVLSCARFKRADYLLPAFPGGALFLGAVLESVCFRGSARPRLAAKRALGLTVALCCVGWLAYVEWVLPGEEPQREFRSFAKGIRQLMPESVTLFRTEAHALAFNLGRPVTILVEWQELAARLARPGRHCVVMPPEWLEECRQLLPGLALEEVLRNTTVAGARHERPLVLLRSARCIPR